MGMILVVVSDKWVDSVLTVVVCLWIRVVRVGYRLTLWYNRRDMEDENRMQMKTLKGRDSVRACPGHSSSLFGVINNTLVLRQASESVFG